MDEELSALVTAVPMDGSRAEEWFATIRTVWEADQGDFDAFLFRLHSETGHLVDDADLDLFRRRLDDLGGDPMEHLRRLAEHEPHELAAHLRDQAEPQEQAEPETGRFDWVQPEQSERMAAAWGPDWSDILTEQLDHRWGEGWEANPPDHKAEWLNDVLAELLADSPPATTEAGRFDWVPVEQADRLASAWGPDWQQYLGDQLDHRWGEGWEANPPDHKAAWLPDVVDDLLTPAEDIPSQPAAPDSASAAGAGRPPADQPAAGPAETEDYSAEDIKSAVDEVIAEVPGAENLSEAELAQIRAEVAAALAREGAGAQ